MAHLRWKQWDAARCCHGVRWGLPSSQHQLAKSISWGWAAHTLLLQAVNKEAWQMLNTIIDKKTFTTPYNVKNLALEAEKIIVFLDWHACPVLFGTCEQRFRFLQPSASSCLPVHTQSGFAPALTHKPGLRSQPAGWQQAGAAGGQNEWFISVLLSPFLKAEASLINSFAFINSLLTFVSLVLCTCLLVRHWFLFQELLVGSSFRLAMPLVVLCSTPPLTTLKFPWLFGAFQQ